MELDIFLPKEQLAFEYQGEHHFHDLYHLGILRQQKERDNEKKNACKEHEITLIAVPYWWSKDTSSLIATIYKERKDLISHEVDGLPIPLNHQNGISSEGEALLLIFADSY